MTKSTLYQFEYTLCNGIETIKTYVSKRYPRYLDYANYHAEIAGIRGDGNDVLNEVLLSLFSKDFEYLAKLYSTRRNGYTDLDFFILQMLKLNCHSMTSPFRHKYKPIPTADEIDYQKLRIADEDYEEVDNPAITLKQFRLVRYIFERLALTEYEKKVFTHGFFYGEYYSNWPDRERERSNKKYYDAFDTVRFAIHQVLFLNRLTRIKPKTPVSDKARKNELVSEFLRMRKIIINHSEN